MKAIKMESNKRQMGLLAGKVKIPENFDETYDELFDTEIGMIIRLTLEDDDSEKESLSD